MHDRLGLAADPLESGVLGGGGLFASPSVVVRTLISPETPRLLLFSDADRVPTTLGNNEKPGIVRYITLGEAAGQCCESRCTSATTLVRTSASVSGSTP